MKRLYALGFSGLVLGTAVVGFNLQTSGPVATETVQAADAAQTPQENLEITVYKSPSCSCCESWGEHLENNGFTVQMKPVENLQEIKKEYGVPRDMMSCHTAVIDGLVIEGHVPADDIKAYLANPTFGTTGLSVPGMPHGTPGMETGREDSFAVLAFTADGEHRVVKSYDK